LACPQVASFHLAVNHDCTVPSGMASMISGEGYFAGSGENTRLAWYLARCAVRAPARPI
jgi:hypothetical protein